MDIRTPDVHYKHRVERAAEEYLASTGVVQAVSGALRSLFSAPWLPDNPYYHLHDALGAYADQSSAWQQNTQLLLAGRGPEGGLEVQVPELQLCKLQGLDCCYGLPHVLRVVHRDACQRLQLLLGSGVPDVLFPGPTPCNAAQGYTLQVLASVQGAACVWNPVAQALPALEEQLEARALQALSQAVWQVRADVVVTGPLVEEAVQLFLDQVLTEAQELQEVPLYFVEGVGVREVDQLHPVQGG
ncbi:uncharacterized protein HaLaN_27235 [Haematococcus lacustris]|uniref:Uncharacterized protein n=1 Tax=Haematococcus lacustris TaxID=44745 RepID=A0A6A0A837_HAELA|nr:uncharacterized protein HaLaN_27235 [Haematococcus lacustris]